MKKNFSNVDSNHLTCDLDLFPGNNKTNIAKSNLVFPGKGRGDKALIVTCLDSPMAVDSPYYLFFFSISAIFRGKRGVKVTKSANFGPVPFP